MFKTTIQVLVTDITKVRADAIVTAANNQLRGGGGVDGAVHKAAGPTVLAACQSLPILEHFRVEGIRCETGDAVATTPGDLSYAKVIIHAVGPRFSAKDPARSAELLASAYTRSLEVAKAHDCRTIAFPCISTGVYGYPMGEAAQIAFKAVTDWLEANPDTFSDVRFVCFEQGDLQHYLSLVTNYMHPLKEWADENGKIKILRCVNDDMTSQYGFVYPTSGPVVCPDWKPNRECGNGLHGWVWEKHGKMGGAPGYVKKDGRWLVIECDLQDVIELGGEKVKFKQGTVIFSGDFEGAAKTVQRSHQIGGFFATLTGGHYATLTGGNEATLTGGNEATLTGGDRATLTGGHYATLTGGNEATLTGGDRATLTGGDRATLTGGNEATLTGGHYATLTGGDRATLTGGDRATLTGGNEATLTGGNEATLTGGDRATLTGGNEATLTGGNEATLTGGNEATLTGGHYATLTGGHYATLTGGNEATLTGGHYATLTGGKSGLACARSGGVVSGDYGTALVLFGWSVPTKKKVKRWRAYTAVVGYTNGIKPNTKYKLVNGKFVEVAAA